MRSEASPYQGTIDIGSSVIFSIKNYFNGFIDTVKLTSRAKTTVEILSTATLAPPYTDAGPNAIIVSGRVNQRIRCYSY